MLRLKFDYSKEKILLFLECCRNGRTNQLNKFLKEEGMDINCENSRGETPLISAVRNGHVQCMEYLLGYHGIIIEKVDSIS